MWKCTRFEAALRRGLAIMAVAFVVSGIGGLTIGCASGDTQSGQEEFTDYWNAMWKVVERENAQTDNALAKAENTDGALNAYQVSCDGFGRAWQRSTSRFAAIEPPSRLAGVHARLVREYRRCARAASRVAAEIERQIRDPGFTELDPDWLDKQSKSSDKAVDRQAAALERWEAAARKEAERLGLEFTSE